MALEPIGVTAIAKGADKFISNMNAMERAYDKTVSAFQVGAGETARAATGTEALGKIISGMVPQLSGAAGSAAGFVSALGPMAIAVGAAMGGLLLLKKAFDAVINAIKSAVSAAKEFIAEGMQMAGRFQEMEISALAIGRAMGLQQEEIKGAIDAVADAGIRYDIASRSVALLARNQIELSKAQELANRAQAAGILFGRGSTEAMEALTTAIATGSTMRLRTLGVTEDMAVFEKRYADAIGKTVEELTHQEQMTARVDGVLQSLSSTMSVYDEVMESPTKRLRSLHERELPTLQATLAGPFLQAWATVVGTETTGIRGFVNALQAAASEGGALYPVLVNLGAIASILADAFSAALGYVTDFVSNLGADLGTGFGTIIVEMARWGAEMVAALAEGIVSAASTVLVMAMNVIGNILSAWLGPGSPPKVAPLLSQWGMEAMTEYLEGFTQADYSVLEKIQSYLSRVLSATDFAAISAEIVEAMATGAVDESLFQRIAQSAGMFGEEIAELARLQFELAEATKAVEDAENRVSEGRQQVRDLTEEYNRMLREGATEKELEAKLAEINAAEEGVEIAKEEAVEAKSRAEQLEEQASLQEKLVQQMLKMTQSVQAVAKSAATMSKAMGKIAKPKIEPISAEDIMPEGLAWDISSKISEAIDKAKADIYEKLAYIFDPLAQSWERMKAGPLADIVKEFNRISPLVVKAIEWMKRAWVNLGLGVRIVQLYFTNIVSPKLKELATDAVEFLRTKVYDLKLEFQWLLNKVRDFIIYVRDEVIPFIKEQFADALNWFKDKVLKPFADMWDRVKQAIQDVKEALEKLKDLAEEVADALRDVGLLGESPSKFEMDLRGVAKAMRQLSQVEMPRLAASVDAPRQTFTPAFAYGPTSTTTRTVHNSPTVNVGPVTINNDMDAEAFQIRVERAVIRASRRYG